MKNEHRWYHWWFEHHVIIPYKFSSGIFGTKVQYKNIYCTLCKRVVRETYKEPYDEK